MRIYAAIMPILLAGCTTLTSEVTLPNNQKGYSINCGAMGISYCLNRAAELCPQGYTLVDRQNAQGYAFVGNFIAPVQQTEILAKCNR
jgi:hypothetical protein